jgi:hypothetical protein
MCRLTDGVAGVWLYKRTSGPGGTDPVNTIVQYAIVDYESHRLAAMARKRLIPETVELWGRGIIVEWATPHLFKKVSPLPRLVSSYYSCGENC